eukprot:s421_g43.t1
MAKQAITKAETDRKLRRVLLRRYRNQHDSLVVGQTCHFWRDAKATDLMKVRRHGPARVLMIEFSEDSQPKLYWLGFKTQLIRAAPHHVRPSFEDISSGIDGLDAARRDVEGLRSRGVTSFLDLSRVPPTTRRRLMEDTGDDRPGLDLPAMRSGSQPSAVDFADPSVAPGAVNESPRSRSNRAQSWRQMRTSPVWSHLILELFRAVRKLVNLLHYHNQFNIHHSLNKTDLLNYHHNLIHCNLQQPQLEIQQLGKYRNLILRWLHSMSQLVPMSDFDFNGNAWTDRKPRSSDPSDDGKNINLNHMIEMRLRTLARLRAMPRCLTSPEPTVITCQLVGIAVAKDTGKFELAVSFDTINDLGDPSVGSKTPLMCPLILTFLIATVPLCFGKLMAAWTS